jgi:hypothetical protein
MLLKTYVDDSADETQERAVVAGAYIGFYHQWNKLQKLWRKRLKRDGIKYFHATEYYSLRGEFLKFRDPVQYPKPKGSEAATAMLNDLEQIISESQVMGIAVCADMQAYNAVRQKEAHANEIFSSDAFESALQALIMTCVKILRDEWKGHRKLAFICDDSNTSPRIARLYSGFVAANPGLAEFLGGLIHRDDKLFPQLQTADMMAHLAKGRFIDWLDDPNKAVFTDDKELKARLKRLSVHQIAVWNREYMLEVLKHEVKARGLSASV